MIQSNIIIKTYRFISSKLTRTLSVYPVNTYLQILGKASAVLTHQLLLPCLRLFQIPCAMYPNILLWLNHLFNYCIVDLLLFLLISAFFTTHILKAEYLYTCFFFFNIVFTFSTKAGVLCHIIILSNINKYITKHGWEKVKVNSPFFQTDNTIAFDLRFR